MKNEQTPRRLLVIGGGVAGIEIASTIARNHDRETLHVTLVDRDSAHIWKPMLHTIAAGTRDISQQQTSFVAQARRAGFTYQLGELENIDCMAREVALAPVHADDGRLLIPGRRLPYDTLVLAIGSEANDFGTPGAAEHCYRIDSRTQADAFNKEIRVRMLLSQVQESRMEDIEINNRGQLLIRPSLQATLNDHIFAVGDCSSLTLPGEELPLSSTAQVAHQQARHLTEHLPDFILNQKPVPDFVYRDFGSLVSLSDYDAFGSLGQFGFLEGTTIRGKLAQLSHAMLYRRHQTRLHGFWRGGLLWLVDRLNARARASIRLD